jgi:hypothetical protein
MIEPLIQLLSGLGYVLDTPGSLARGVLSGRPGERVGGREMLEEWGALEENKPGLDWGDALGFGAEMLVDPLNLLAGAPLAYKALGKLDKLTDLKPHQLAAAGPEMGMLPLSKIRQATGRNPRIPTMEELQQAHGPWGKSLSPEEIDAFSAIDSTLAEGIEQALTKRPFDGDSPNYAPLQLGIPPINSEDQVWRELISYLDPAIARGETPHDMMLYSDIGPRDVNAGAFSKPLTPQNAKQMVGQTVHQRTYPFGEFSPFREGSSLGRDIDPESVMLNLLVPQGGQSVLSPPHHPHIKTRGPGDYLRPLFLPRDTKMRIAGAVDQPIARVGHAWSMLDPAGRPFPEYDTVRYSYGNDQIWKADAAKRWLEETAQSGQIPEFVPEEIMLPGWEKMMGQESVQKHLIAEAQLPPPIPGARSPYRRLSNEEILQAMEEARRDPKLLRKIQDDPSLERYLDSVMSRLHENPRRFSYDDLRSSSELTAPYPEANPANLLRSVPVKDPGWREIHSEASELPIEPEAMSQFAETYLTPGARVRFRTPEGIARNTETGQWGEHKGKTYGDVQSQILGGDYTPDQLKEITNANADIRSMMTRLRENDQGTLRLTPDAQAMMDPNDPRRTRALEYSEDDLYDINANIEGQKRRLKDIEQERAERMMGVQLDTGENVLFGDEANPIQQALAHLSPEQAIQAENRAILRGLPMPALLSALLGYNAAILPERGQ